MRVDATGNVYVAGIAYSDPFPTTPGVYRRDHIPSSSNAICRGMADQFLAKFDSALSRLLFSTLAGTSGNDVASDLAIGADGSLYLAGSDGSIRDCQHPMLTRFTADGRAVAYSVMLALGPTPTGGYNVVVDSVGNAYLATDTRGYVPPSRGGLWKLDPQGRDTGLC